MISVTRRVLWLAALGLAACGRLSGNETSQGSGAGGAGGGMGADAAAPGDGICSPTASLAPARILLLTDEQYTNAMRDLFGVQFQMHNAQSSDADVSSYLDKESLTVSSSAVVQGYHSAAQQVARKLKPCGANPPDASCMGAYVRNKLPLAWRRPVTDDEITGIMNLFTAGLAISPDRAVEVVICAMLESGSFLYRTEIGNGATAGATTSLTPYELASAVSFAFLDSVPDAELWSKAQDGSLLQPSVLSAEADRLLAVAAVRDNLRKKVSFFLNLEKIPTANNGPFSRKSSFPEFTASIRTDLYQGAQLFLDDVVWRGHFPDLFTSHRVYVNGEVGSMYGIPGVTTSQLTAVDVATDERGAGILTQPAFLAATNDHDGSDDIVHRGLSIYDAFDCGMAIAAPPAGESDVFQTLNGTTGEKWRQVDKLSCGGCHALFDPLGLSTQAYDPIGRYRTIDPESGKPMDATAVIQGLGPDLDGPVNGINDVAKRFAVGRRASDCTAGRVSRMTLDHIPFGPPSCQLQSIKDELAQSGSFSRFFKAIITSPAFLTRDWDPK